MKISLKKLELINFGSWQHAVLGLESRGLVLLQGKTGAGKSTLFRALYWALYGESACASDEVINDQIGKNTAVSLEFSVGDDQYKVTRYRKHVEWKNKAVLWINGTVMGEKDSKVESINQMITQVLSIDAETFLKTVYFVQRDTQRFPALTDAHQKRLIEAITDLAILPRAERVTRDQLMAAQRMQTRVSERCQRYEETISSLAQLITRAKTHASKELGETQDRLQEVSEAYTSAERDWTRRTTHAAELREGREECARELHRDRDELLRVGKQIELLEQSRADVTCPTCGTLLKSKRRLVMVRQMQGHQQRLDQSIEQSEADIEQITKQMIALTSATVREELERLKTQQNVLTNQLALQSKPTELTDLQQQLASAIAKRDSAVRIKASVDHHVQRLEFWVKGFGRTGLRTLLLPQVLAQLTERTNYFLSAFDGAVVRVWYELVDGRIAQVYRTHAEATLKGYATLSGGERQMVEVCTSLALRELAEASRANELDCVFLDEPLEGLDAQLAQYLPRLLAMVQKASVFIISHSDVLAPYFSTILTVRKTSRISSLVSS